MRPSGPGYMTRVLRGSVITPVASCIPAFKHSLVLDETSGVLRSCFGRRDQSPLPWFGTCDHSQNG